MTTLKELLAVPRFSDLHILTHEANLDIPVHTIEITETPDVSLYIPTNVFILSTGMVFKDRQEALIPFIDSLIEAKAVGLAIKLNRFLGEIQPEVLAYANQKKFPLIQIPGMFPLGSLLHQMQNFLWDTKEEEINFAMDIQKSFSALLMNDATVSTFTKEIGKTIKSSILVLDPFFRVHASSKYFQHKTDAANHFASTIWKHYGGARLEQDTFLVTTLDGEEIQIAVYPINVYTYFPHYLVVLAPEKIPYPISSFAIEQAALVLSFILYKNTKVEESQQHMQHTILQRFIETRSAALTQANARLLEVGTSLRLLDSTHNQIVFIEYQSTDDSSNRVKMMQEKGQLVLQWFQERLAEFLPSPIVLYSSDDHHITFLLQSKTARIGPILTQLAEELESRIPVTIHFFFGGAYESLARISDSYIEAELAKQNARERAEIPRISHFKPHGLKQLFDLDDRDSIYYFVTTTLKDLAYPEEDSLIELHKTLKNYLDNQSQITKTSQDLFIHRNTVKYRIERCEEILGQSLTDPEVSLNVRLALELSMLDS